MHGKYYTIHEELLTNILKGEFQFIAGVVDTSDKFFAGNIDTSDNL
jgi:hypothetical protein